MTATMAPAPAASGPKQPVDVDQARKHTDDRWATERLSEDEALSVEATNDKRAPQPYRGPADGAITLTREAAHGGSRDEEVLRRAIEDTGLGTWDWIISTHELTWSDSCKTIFGLDPQAPITYARFLAAIHAEDRARIMEAIERALAPSSSGDYHVELRVLRPDGTVRWLVARGKVSFATTNGETEPHRFTGTALDITERKQLEHERDQLVHELELAVKARDEFVAILSHDLRSPIHTISLTAESLVTQLPDNLVEQRKRVQAIRRAAAHATRLIEDLLQEISAPGGDLLLSIEPHDPRAIVSEVAARFEPAPPQRGASLAVEILGDPKLVLCDRSSILRVFENLVGNAKKFTSARGVITLRVEAGVDTVKFSVTDTGPGIAAEDASRLFERGFRGDRVGLGLAIVKRIVEAHGGTVGVESTVGRGSTFWFVLPAA